MEQSPEIKVGLFFLFFPQMHVFQNGWSCSLICYRQENNAVGSSERLENKVISTEPAASAGTMSPSVKHTGVVSSTEFTINSDAALLEASASVEQTHSLPTGKIPENLLDERSLLSCIVRTIPAGGIRISSTVSFSLKLLCSHQLLQKSWKCFVLGQQINI